MSVQLYWKERLAAGAPTQFYKAEGVDVKHRKDRMEEDWPHSVARSSMMDDYLRWHDQIYLAPFKEVEYYQSHPEALPAPADQLTFSTTISPWLYIISKQQQVRNYPCDHQVQVNGVWMTQAKGRYFVRLAQLKFHVAAFENLTGCKVTDPSHYFNPHMALVTHEGELEFLRLVTERR
jgi:hypothetical protein